jgi:hypothetical protein
MLTLLYLSSLPGTYRNDYECPSSAILDTFIYRNSTLCMDQGEVQLVFCVMKGAYLKPEKAKSDGILKSIFPQLLPACCH